MPTSADVLEGLARMCRDLRWLAGIWAIPLLSVSVTTWSYGNPFNGALFLLAAMATLLLALRSGGGEITMASMGRIVPGAAMIAFGWLYPHFLEEGSTFDYL